MAEVERSGSYHREREFFLQWFENYISGTIHGRNAKIWALIDRELRPYRHLPQGAVSGGFATMRSALAKT